MSVLEVSGLSVEFRVDSGTVRAVNDVSFAVEAGRTLAIVGESGSGKTATALSILRLNPQPPCVYTGGQILFEGRDLLAVSKRELRSVRGRGIAMVFQEPMTSLNPVSPSAIRSPRRSRQHDGIGRKAARARAVEMLGSVGIPDPAERVGRLPAPALRRDAPARHDRDGAGLRARAADRRRADHRARRHDPGADPRPARRAAGASSAWR